MAFALFDLTGRRALVTGSSQGIGLALAEGLAAHGAEVLLNGRDPARVSVAVESLAARGHRAGSSVFDVTDPAAVAEAVAALEAEGPIDILVNNAGIQHRAPLEDFPVERWRALMETNVSSLFYVGQAVARGMIARARGKIINIASVQSELARPGIAPYTAAKGAVRRPDARHGNRLGEVWPAGQCDRARLLPHPAQPGPGRQPRLLRLAANRTPAGRWGEVPELIGAAVFLASAASSFVNGHTLFVDGGITTSL